MVDSKPFETHRHIVKRYCPKDTALFVQETFHGPQKERMPSFNLIGQNLVSGVIKTRSLSLESQSGAA